MHNKTTLKTFQHRIIRWGLLLTVNSLPTRNNIGFEMLVCIALQRGKKKFLNHRKSLRLFLKYLACYVNLHGQVTL